MALKPSKKSDIDAILEQKTIESFGFSKEDGRTVSNTTEQTVSTQNKELVQVITRIPKWVLEKQNAKYEAKGLKPAQWIRTLIMEDVQK